MGVFTKNDVAALELAIKLTLAEPDRAEQITSMLEDNDRAEVGEFCAYHRQYAALHLKPWESPPCWIDDPDAVLASTYKDFKSERPAALLLKKMLALGISKYHPDPLAAIEAAEARH